MYFCGAFLISLLAAGNAAVALPAPGINGDNASIKAVHNKAFRPNGPAALAKAYRKFNSTVPQDVVSAMARHNKRTTGSVVTTPQQYDSEYLCPVQIGRPAQTLYLDFDTGSSDLWVFSTQTPRSEVHGQALYSPGSSSTARLLEGETWSITYGDRSSSSGDVYSDIVTVGGLSVSGQAVESAEQVSAQFSNGPSSGLLGLAFSSLNTVAPDKQKTFFDNASRNLNSALFTANLKHNADGTYNFGYVDASEHTGSITYTAVDNSQGFWSWTSTGYAVGNGQLNDHYITGIADTGTTLLLLDDSTVNDYYSQVSGAAYDSSQGGYTFPCRASLPSFTFGVEYSSITIPGSFMKYAPTDDSGVTCFGGLQSSSGIGINIFGDIALKAALVVFDGGNLRLGWASKSV